MQFKSIFTILSVALAATALPTAEDIEARTTPTCSQSQTVKCCDSVNAFKGGILTVLPILQNLGIGLNCVLPIAGGCLLNSQKQTCCAPGSNYATGLIAANLDVCSVNVL